MNRLLEQCRSSELLKFSPLKSFVQGLNNNTVWGKPSDTKLEIDFQDITFEEFMKIFKLLPWTYDYLGGFLTHAFEYEAADEVANDEYRHPIVTLKSGQGDCDDYCVISAFWALLHGKKPSKILINNVANTPEEKDQKAHVFITFPDDSGRLVVVDNNFITVLDEGKDVDDYILDRWEKYDKICEEVV